MISFSDQQLTILLDAAADLPPEKHDTFLRRTVARLETHHNFTDADVMLAAKLALQGLVQHPAA